MKDPGMARIWHDLAADNRALLAGIRAGLGRRSYSDDEMKMLETEAARFERLAVEYEAEHPVTDQRQARPGLNDERR